MPEICRFYGIIITLNFDDHNPPHFHVRYNQNKAIFEIATGALLAGDLPPRALGLVAEWARIRKKDLEENWQLAQQHKQVKKIKPLE